LTNIITKKVIGRIFRNIKNDKEISSKIIKELKSINLCNLFLESCEIADKKYPDRSEDNKYMAYLLTHFREIIIKQGLVI